MLQRQKTILAILREAKRPLTRTALVKLAFLLGQESELGHERTYYDFVPYKFGPFSFALFREIDALKKNGYVDENDNERVTLAAELLHDAQRVVDELPSRSLDAVRQIVRRYGRMAQKALIQDVYARYPWYASRSERKDLRINSDCEVRDAAPAVYTIGYQHRSVDGLFNRLLREGIRVVADVRANPVSRKYGFARRLLAGISNKLAIEYRHFPELGIPSKFRTSLSGYASYQRLLERYERETLPKRTAQIAALADLMQRVPTVLLCMENDVQCCHRSRLAEAVAKVNKLPIRHLT